MLVHFGSTEIYCFLCQLSRSRTCFVLLLVNSGFCVKEFLLPPSNFHHFIPLSSPCSLVVRTARILSSKVFVLFPPFFLNHIGSVLLSAVILLATLNLTSVARRWCMSSQSDLWHQYVSSFVVDPQKCSTLHSALASDLSQSCRRLRSFH